MCHAFRVLHKQLCNNAAMMQAGGIPTSEMYRTFNMGVGLVVVVPQSAVEAALATDEAAFVLGSVASGKEVQLV